MAENNDRVTRALLTQVVENNTKALERNDLLLQTIDALIRILENRIIVLEVRYENLKDDVDRIDRRAKGWDMGNSLAAMGAMILAWFK